MATPILNRLSLDLAFKLQDPVASGVTNGKRYSAANRLGYLVRAYRRLLRTVTLFYPSLINKLFQSFYAPFTVNTAADGTLSATTYAEIYDIYCKEPSDEIYTRAQYISPELYLSVKNGENDFYEPDLNTDRFYWSLLNGYIMMLPQVTYNLNFTARPDNASLVETNGYDATYDIDIVKEYSDLLLGLASAEAYLDLGEANLVQAYKNDVLEQLQLLTSVKQEKERKDETEETI